MSTASNLKCEILVPLSGQEADQATLRQAKALAGWLGGGVMSVLTQPNPADVMVWTADGAFASMPSNLVELAWAGADEAWNKAQSLAANSPIERIIGPVQTSLAKRAALADLVMVSCESARGKTLLSAAFDTLVMEARAPVFIPRADGDTLVHAIEAGVMVAWNGSIEGARAVRAAMPILAKTKKIIIAHVGQVSDTSDTDLGDPARLVDYLASSGLQAEVRQLSGKDAAKALLDAAKADNVGLLVAGAWGHSRAREFVFGGATRTFLKDTTSPSLLLAH